MKIFFMKFTYLLIIFFIIITSLNCSFADDYLEDNPTVDVSSEISETIAQTTDSLESSSINSRSCIVYDRNSHMILYGKNEKTQVKMASTTKIMTSIIIIENYNLSETIEVSKKAAGTGSHENRCSQWNRDLATHPSWETCGANRPEHS